MALSFTQRMMPKIDQATRQQHVFRWGTTILVGVLAALDLWSWAWLVLGLALFATLIDIGMALVISLVNVVAVQLPPPMDTRGGTQRAA